MMFRFAYPALLMLIIPVIIWLLFTLRKKRAGVTFSSASQLIRISGRGNRLISHLSVFLRTCCLVLLLLAAARPQMYNVSREIKSPGIDMILSLDTSESMAALDFQLDNNPVTRLTAVKKVVTDFIKKREMDRIGLVVFGEQAFTQAPLTLDKGLLLDLVDRMEIGMAGGSTAIGSAIAIAGKRLKDLDAKSKILILLTDGKSNAGEIAPEKAAEAVAALGVKIYTIGVGGKGPAPFKMNTIFGTRIVNQNVEFDEEALIKIADIGGGKYFRAADSDKLAEIYNIIDREEKTEVRVKEFFHFKELYYFFLISAIIMFLLELSLKTTVLRVIP